MPPDTRLSPRRPMGHPGAVRAALGAAARGRELGTPCVLLHAQTAAKTAVDSRRATWACPVTRKAHATKPQSRRNKPCVGRRNDFSAGGCADASKRNWRSERASRRGEFSDCRRFSAHIYARCPSTVRARAHVTTRAAVGASPRWIFQQNPRSLCWQDRRASSATWVLAASRKLYVHRPTLGINPMLLCLPIACHPLRASFRSLRGPADGLANGAGGGLDHSKFLLSRRLPLPPLIFKSVGSRSRARSAPTSMNSRPGSPSSSAGTATRRTRSV